MKIGTTIHRILGPFAKFIDFLSGGRTHLASCEGCKKRAAYLDSLDFKLSIKDRLRLTKEKVLHAWKNRHN